MEIINMIEPNRKYWDFLDRETFIGDDVISLVNQRCGRVVSWTAGGNPRIIDWNKITKKFTNLKPAALTGRWIVIRPLEG